MGAALYETPLPHRLVLLDGNTGTAKTEMLHRLAARGLQVLDLEGLAVHRGSLLGAVDSPQPSQKAFETALAVALDDLDPGRVVVAEAESNKVGVRSIPPMLWAAMKAAPRIELAAPVAARAGYLLRAYADMVQDRAGLRARLAGLTRLRGHEMVSRWLDLADRGRFTDLATELMIHHYDPAYAKSRAAHPRRRIARLETDDLSDAGREALAARIADHLKEF